ncbi:hypothetical protein ABZ826_06075 [Streptomyces sp. NPDC047515]|uniref:hypothetical protein n=1 Tax=Streptomyces sp. NPDC047515 TaxID=3155380 RepID=UPI0033E94AC2
MSKKGYEWKRVAIPEGSPGWRNRLHFGVMEQQVAEKFGYHTPAELLAPPESREMVVAMKTRKSSLPQRANQSAKDCQDQADRTLTHEAKAPFAQFNDLKSETFEAAKRSPEVRQAMQSWSACMKKEGYDYETSWDADQDRRWYAKDKASREELTTARVDVKCKRKVSLVKVWFSAEKVLEEAAIKQHKTYFAQLKTANRRYLDNARLVLARQESS